MQTNKEFEGLEHSSLELIALCKQLLSKDEEVREQAEREVQLRGCEYAFGLSLACLAFDGGSGTESRGRGCDGVAVVAVEVRHLCALLLKKYVKERWQAGESDFLGRETSHEEKKEIKRVCVRGLESFDSKIRTAAAVVIGKIAVHDWPEEWQDLLSELIEPIRAKTDVNFVNGALRCLAMLASELDERQAPMFVPELFPELVGLLSASDVNVNTGISSDDMLLVKCRAFDVMRECFGTLGMIGDERARVGIKEAARPFLETCFKSYGSIFEFKADVGETRVGCMLTMSTLKAMQMTMQFFGKDVTQGNAVQEHVFAGCVERFFHVFERATNRYVSCRGTESETLEGCEDDEGNVVSNSAIVAQCMELTMTMIENSKIAKSCVEPRLRAITSMAVAASLTTDEQLETWEEDVNQFVADEEDDYQSVRATTEVFLDSLSGKFPKTFFAALAEVVAEQFEKSFAQQNANDENWWRAREAALFAVGGLSEQLLEHAHDFKQKNMSAPFDCDAFLNEIIRSELNPGAPTFSNTNAFLKGRALWAASRLAAASSANGANAILDASVNALNDPNAQFPVKIGACRSLIAFVPMVKTEHQKNNTKAKKKNGDKNQASLSEEDEMKVQKLLSRLGDVYQGLGQLLTDATEDALVLILEALLEVVRADGDAALRWLSLLAPAIIRIWAENVRDPLIGATARDVIQALANQPKCNAELTQLVVPELAKVFSTPNEQPEMLVEASLDILACLLKPCVDEIVARNVFAATFVNLSLLAKTSDDVGIVQNALDAMKAFLRAAKGEGILSWGSDPNAVSRAYLDACATSLNPNCEEGASLFVAPLLGQMIRRLPSIVGPMIPEICDAVCARLQTSTRPMLISALLCIFARLAHVDANALVSLLASRELVPNAENEQSKTQLEFVLKKWSEGQSDVHGRFDVKLTTTALGLILATQHPNLINGSIILKGSPIELDLPAGTIRTRSRSKQTGPVQFTQVSAPSKIVSLLADSLAEATELEEGEWEEDIDVDDDDVSLDDDDDNEDNEDEERAGWSGDIFEKIMLKGLLDQDFFADEDDDDKDDPIDEIDLTQFLEQGFKSLAKSGSLEHFADCLSEAQKQCVAKAVLR